MTTLTNEKVAERLTNDLGYRFRRDRQEVEKLAELTPEDIPAVFLRNSAEDRLRAQVRVAVADEALAHLESEGAGNASLQQYVLFAIGEATSRGFSTPFQNWKAAEKVKARLEIAGMFGAYIDTEERQPEGSPSYGAGEDEPSTESRRQCHYVAQAEYRSGAVGKENLVWQDTRKQRDTREEAEADLAEIIEEVSEPAKARFYTGRTRLISRGVHIVESVLISKGGEA